MNCNFLNTIFLILLIEILNLIFKLWLSFWIKIYYYIILLQYYRYIVFYCILLDIKIIYHYLYEYYKYIFL